MPKFNTDNMTNYSTITGHYGFSGQKADKLGASEYTLVQTSVDDSGSVASFQDELESCVRASVEACKDPKNPHRDFLMFRLAKFSDQVDEVHGFKLLSEIDCASYQGFLGRSRTTCLFDAIDEGVNAIVTYGSDLSDKHYTVNGLFFLITDGCEYGSRMNNLDSVKKSLEKARQSEKLDSFKIILVGVNITDPEVSRSLQNLVSELKIDQYLELDKADPKTLAKLTGFFSKSVSASAQSRGTGGPSKNLTF